MKVPTYLAGRSKRHKKDMQAISRLERAIDHVRTSCHAHCLHSTDRSLGFVHLRVRCAVRPPGCHRHSSRAIL